MLDKMRIEMGWLNDHLDDEQESWGFCREERRTGGRESEEEYWFESYGEEWNHYLTWCTCRDGVWRVLMWDRLRRGDQIRCTESNVVGNLRYKLV